MCLKYFIVIFYNIKQVINIYFYCNQATEMPEKFPDGNPDKFLEHVIANGEKGNLSDVIATIDEYCWNKEWHMNVGDVKGEILDKMIEEQAPKTLLVRKYI